MAELKPCPFCGSKPRVVHYEDSNDIRRYVVRCVRLGCPCNPLTYTCAEAEKAIEAWNRRAGDGK